MGHEGGSLSWVVPAASREFPSVLGRLYHKKRPLPCQSVSAGQAACQIGKVEEWRGRAVITNVTKTEHEAAGRPMKPASPFGTWYTDAGERADAWPGETRPALAAPSRSRSEALVASSVHAMAGAGGGLVSRVGRLLGGATASAPIARLL